MYDVVRHWADTNPHRPALLQHGIDPLSYSGLLKSIDAMGATLNSWGFGRNDRIAIVHPGGRDMAAAIMGIWCYATPVPLNPESTLGEFAIQLRDMRVKAIAIVTDMDTPARRAAADMDLPILDLQADDNGGMKLIGTSRAEAPSTANAGPVQADDIVAVLATSGTTSHSKIVPIRHRQLIARNALAARDLGITVDDRSLNMLRLYHSGGLGQGISTPLIAGSSVAVLTDFSVDGIFETLNKEQVTWCAASYAVYHAIHPHLETYRPTIERIASRLRFMRSGTGPLNAAVAEKVEAAFGVPIVVTYGTSEAGSSTSDPPDRPRPDRSSVGKRAHDGVDILGETGTPLPHGATGEIAVRGPTVFDGYENDDAANRIAFMGEWFRTGDLGYFDDDGYLFITGRIKEMINRGGQNITPVEIDHALLAHPDIIAASSFPIPHATLGEDVAAAVVPRDGATLDQGALSQFLRGRLADYKVPRQLIFTEEIPKGPTGKVQRHKLAEIFSTTPDAPAPPATTSNRKPTPLERQLQSLWAAALGRDHVGLDDDFFQLGGDSLQAVELFLRIEKTLGHPLPRSVLFEAGTVAAMAKHIEASSSTDCVVPIRPDGRRPPLFCIHDINGQVLNFRALAQYLDDDQPVYGVQSVGLDHTEPPLVRIEDMAVRYITEIRQVQPAGPYYIGGYSMGGWIAYEIAQQLRQMGQPVALLALFDTNPRQGHGRATLSGWMGHHRNRLSELKAADIGPYLTQRLLNMGTMAATKSRERLFSTAWRIAENRGKAIPAMLNRPTEANLMAVRSYQPRRYDGDAVLLKAAPYAWMPENAHEGWRNLIGGDLEIRPVPGNHDNLLEEPHVRDVANALSECLTARQNTPPTPQPVDRTPLHSVP
jgi:acyl-CoA synthetase (AMP-forming)/AMP-acid ligase II/thioesterase domain-containing protein/acyl carrier protein